MEKKYDRLRLNTGQHRRVMLAALVLCQYGEALL